MTKRDICAELNAALGSADPRVLAAVVTHLAADSVAVRPGIGDEELRTLALDVLMPYCSGKKKLAAPSEEVLQVAMDRCAGEPVPREYAPMMRDQAGIGPQVATAAPLEPPPGFRAVVIGAGFSGLGVAMAFAKAGVDYTIIEKNEHFGGTWFENTFPGCGVDTPSHLYSYSYAQNPRWTRYFSLRDEVLAYIEDVATRHALERRIRFERTVETVRWDDEQGIWVLTLARPDGTTEQLEAEFVVSAVGVLNQPKIPPIAGLERFRGQAFHSARWDHGFDPAGKRVAVIGAGASANQIVPELSKTVAHLDVFQRSPQWMMPVPEAFHVFDAGARWLFEHVPGYTAWFRFMLLWFYGDTVFAQLRIDPNWPHQDRSANAVNDQWRQDMTAYIRAELSDPDLLAKSIPSYPPWGKRMLVDHGWYKALRRENVDLITAPIERVTEDGIVIEVEEGARFDGIIHVASVGTAPGGRAVAFHPRLLVVLHKDARLMLAETGDGAAGACFLDNPVSEITLAAGAHLTHVRLQDLPETAAQLATTYVRLAERAEYDSFVLAAGAAIARNEIHATLAGPHGTCHLNGAQLLHGRRHADTTTAIDHAAPRCASRQTYKSVLGGASRAVFQGRIHVHQVAQKTDGYQMNQALLLSPDAEMDSKPQLEIFADDVKCSHGATVGELDEAQLFYLRSRGIPEDEARSLLVHAFLADALELVTDEALRGVLAEATGRWWEKLAA